MSAYIIVGFTPKNRDLLKEYSAKAAPTLSKYQGEFLVKAPVQPLNGKSHPEYQLIIAFPSKILAESWYFSPHYQKLIDLRDQGMEANFQLVA